MSVTNAANVTLTCTNRLVQHGLQVRLQLFKTQNKGWGIRCLDDIAKALVCKLYGLVMKGFLSEVRTWWALNQRQVELGIKCLTCELGERRQDCLPIREHE